jgi:hypothetical protein
MRTPMFRPLIGTEGGEDVIQICCPCALTPLFAIATGPARTFPFASLKNVAQA